MLLIYVAHIFSWMYAVLLMWNLTILLDLFYTVLTFTELDLDLTMVYTEIFCLKFKEGLLNV